MPQATDAPTLPVVLTIDKNRINARQSLAGMNTLERWQSQNKVRLVAARRIAMEPDSDVDRINKIRTLPKIEEPMVLDESFLDVSYFADDPGPQFDQLASIMFPGVEGVELTENQRHDVMHLMTHAFSSAVAFVTYDLKGFIRGHRRNALLSKFAIQVMTDDEAVAWLTRKYGWK